LFQKVKNIDTKQSDYNCCETR